MKVEAIGDYAIVELDLEEDMIGDVAVPDRARERANIGCVISAGPDCSLVKNGDRVIIHRGAGRLIKDRDDYNKFHLLVAENTILARIDDE